MYRINFKFKEHGLDPIVLKDVQPGYSLLEIALNNRIDLHHQCGGICSCSTCHIHLVKGEEFVTEKSKREMDLIEKAVDQQMDSRLACQCLLQEGRGEIEVIIPDQTGQ